MAETTKQLSPAAQFHESFVKMESQFSLALPAHMPVERFMRVVLTAVNGNPELLEADRASLFEAAMKAAQDGLLPDGREGALVIYNTKVSRRGEADRWIKKVQWMPMVGGIMKKARNSGDIKLITAGYVVGGDKFRYWVDDDGEHIFYEPGEKQDFSIFVCAFAMAKTKDGTVYAIRVTPADVEKMRNASKAKDGSAWKNWFDQMAMKGAIRRLAKRLPMSSDLDDLIRRDDSLYDFKSEQVQFQPVKHPLKDEPPKSIEHNAEETAGDDTQAQDAEELGAEMVIDGDGKITKAPKGEPETILDYRFPDEPYFANFKEWLTLVEQNNLSNPLVPASKDEKSSSAAEGAGEAAGEAEKGDDKPAPAGAQTAPAASQSPGKGQSEGKDAKAPAEKPYSDGETYMGWLQAQLGTAKVAGVLKTKAAVNEMWGSTRNDRQELCSADQLEAAADMKNAANERIAKGK